jgi:4-alpha-glucanotransferase
MSATLLRRLAEQHGILAEFVDVTGVRRVTSDQTRAALLSALGIDCSNAAALRAAYYQSARSIAPLAAARVVERGRAARLTLPADPARAGATWELRLTTEEGEVRCTTGSLAADGRLQTPLPDSLPLGYHQLEIAVTGGAGERLHRQTLIVAPRRCPEARSVLGNREVFGLQANLYTVRSDDDWGVGGFAELRALVQLAAANGAAFVGVNPLAALDNRAGAISPYSPLSRLFLNPLYLDVNAFPEFPSLPDLRAHVDSADFRLALARLRSSAEVCYADVMDLKHPCFASLHRAFRAAHGDRGTARGRAYADYCQRRGETLLDFATFLALRDHLGRGAETAPADWRQWPAPFRDPRSAAVRSFRAAHGEAVDLHCFLQFELDRQLGEVANSARRLGMPLGLYQDLPLGSAPDGADSWAFQDSFANGVSIGAPPDDYNAAGQDWGLPPLIPQRLAADGFRYWIELLRATLRGAGALRIDHVMGLFRQYWIPAGAAPAAGAYVRYPAAELLGVLALEATRAGALVIGEDLGTVPREVPPLLAKWNILSTRVLYFSRDQHGEYPPARRYPRRCLLSANTHDLVPLAGFWSGRDLHIRRALGVLDSDAALDAKLAEREADRTALLRRLRGEKLLPPGDGDPGAGEVRRAVHAFLCRSPARLVGIALDDLLGEEVPVNQPGVPLERYPSWTRRARLSLQELADDTDSAAALAALRHDPRSLRRHPAAERATTVPRRQARSRR